MINILINGISGKMGGNLVNSAKKHADINIACGVDRITDNGYTFPTYTSFDQVTQKIDVIIDFSVPKALGGILNYATENKIPCVLATTGFSAEDEKSIEKAGKIIPIFKTGNFSLGINVLGKLASLCSALLGGKADIEITETHHNQKVDAPSGTAKMLLNAVQNGNTYNTVYGREGIVGKRSPNEIGVHAIRGGTVVGKHEVQFFLDNEVITIKHEAESKSVFANGAIEASLFIVGKPSGLYDMNDLVK